MNIVLYPNAKINLGLRILQKRPDGYHDLETLFLPVTQDSSLLREGSPSLKGDILEIVTSNKTSISHYGLRYSLPNSDMEEDLCIKAYRLLQKDYHIPPVEIHLYKQIPVGAGLGGGSADAAFTLKGLNSLFRLGIEKDKLAAYAAMLGSDCPFFIYNTPMFGQGRGELLSLYDAPWLEEIYGRKPKYRIEVRTFSIHVSTALAYSGVTPSLEGRGLINQLSKPIEQWSECIINDFEEIVFAKFPQLAAEKKALYDEGAIFAQMSGSGSSIFGIFPR